MPFIVLEGIDASGKKTQTELLYNRLKELGKAVEIISFPRYDTFFGDLVAKYLRGEFGKKEKLRETAAMLYALDRYQFKDELKQKLNSGVILIANRYTQSNIGFQAAKFDDDNERLDFVRWINSMESRLPQPDMVVFLDVPVEHTERMIAGREDKEYLGSRKKDIHEEDIEFQKKVRRTYLEAAKLEQWKIIRCAKDGIMRHPDDIHYELWENVKGIIKA